MRKLFGKPPVALTIGIMGAVLSASAPRADELAGRLVINEVMSANATGVQDEEGDYPDWIELENVGDGIIDLEGCALSNDLADPQRWRFPPCLIRPHARLLLFASGKDRVCFVPGWWETILDRGDVVSYRVGSSEPPPDWREPGFDDAGWPAGPTGIGRGDDDDATCITSCPSFALRHEFELADPAAVSAAMLHIDYDDGFVAYLNGVEIARANVGTAGSPPPYDEPAHVAIEARLYQEEPPVVYDLAPHLALLRTGTNVLAIQTHTVATDSDLTMIPFLTFGLDARPADARGVAEEVRHDFPHLHTDFKLNQDGDLVLLTAPDGSPLDTLFILPLPGDVSFGLYPDGEGAPGIFAEPTPWTANVHAPCTFFVDAPEASVPGGFHAGQIAVTLDCPTSGAEIRYTLDGSDPAEEHPLCAEPLILDETSVLRARAFLAGGVPSSITTRTYLFDETVTMATVSLVTDPDNLWDDEIGLLAIGDGSPEYPHLGANFWKEWERPVHIEMFEPDGAVAFSLDAGIRVFGGASRAISQKSFQIVSRDSYGLSPIPYRVFPQLEIDAFKQLLLRNSGQDCFKTHFRDGLMHELAAPLDVDVEAFRPAVIFLNGEYWGILNLRERQNEHYLASHHDIDPEAVDMVRFPDIVIAGDLTDWNDLVQYIDTHPLQTPAHYAHVAERYDIRSFREYNAMNIFFGNHDWPGANTKFWRPWTGEPGWRHLAFDMDAGLGIVLDPDAADLARVLAIRAGEYPFSLLCDNATFRRDLTNTFTEMMSGCLSVATMTAKLDEFVDVFAPEIERHFERWERDPYRYDQAVDVMRDYMERRQDYIIEEIRYEFGLQDTLRLSLAACPPGSGYFDLTTGSVEGPWSGFYFRGNPIPLTPVARPGWAFMSWSDPDAPGLAAGLLEPTGDLELTAHFAAAASIVINEINYHSADGFDPGDWVELHNTTDAAIDIGGCVFTDCAPDHEFVLPRPCLVPAGGFVVLCRDRDAFRALFPEIEPVTGELGFGLSNGGETLRLLGCDLALLDEVTYDDAAPWPPQADGCGPTLELRDPASDNALPDNWGASAGHGTPGLVNSNLSVGVAERPVTPFALDALFPNPFNPATTVAFSLPAAADVEIAFFDVNGRRIEHRPLGRLPAGRHAFEWRPDRLASGLYLCRLRAGARIATRRVMLLK